MRFSSFDQPGNLLWPVVKEWLSPGCRLAQRSFRRLSFLPRTGKTEYVEGGFDVKTYHSSAAGYLSSYRHIMGSE
jgi:hypothetical protein